MNETSQMDEELLNPFIEDGVYCLRRASRALQDKMDRDLFYDAALYYAFGVEKLCKAIVHAVNPVFLLESHGFENAVCALYENRLIDRARKKVDKDVNRSLIPFKTSVLRAAKFSQAVEDNIGRLTELADIRGVLAHRAWSELDWERAGDFLMRTFVPTVDLFANELDIDADGCFESEDHRAWLKKTSDHLLAQENYPEYLKGILARHLAIWERRRGDPSALQKAAAATDSLLERTTKNGPYPHSGVCPCCKQPAVLFYRFTDIYGRDEVTTTGTYAVGLACCYCDLQLSGYRAVDHFKLNDQGFGPFRWTMKIGDLKGD
jgi:hypothetical protein